MALKLLIKIVNQLDVCNLMIELLNTVKARYNEHRCNERLVITDKKFYPLRVRYIELLLYYYFNA